MSVSRWKEIVVQFDVVFDLTFAHDHGLGELMKQGAWNPPLNESGTLAEGRIRYLGACWCRMRTADVLYHRLHEGLDAYLDSHRLAEETTECLLSSQDTVGKELEISPHTTVSPENSLTGVIPVETNGANYDSQFLCAYVLARWWDSYGRLYYRCGDHTVARLAFEKAKRIVERYELWWCSPDITSNWLRASYEELKGFKQHHTFDGNQYKISIEHSLNGIVLQDPPLPFDNATCRREHARGLASLRHNYAHWLRARKDPKANQMAQLSLYWAVENRDDYRAAQSQLFFGQNTDAFLEERKSSLVAVTKSKWIRGRKIASQNLLDLEHDFKGLVELGREEFNALSGREKQGGLDLDFFAYTVSLAKAASAMSTEKSVGTEREDALGEIALLERECYEMQRQVTTVSAYKKNFSNYVRPYFLEQLDACVNNEEGSPEDELALIEEASARELLDIVSQRGGR